MVERVDHSGSHVIVHGDDAVDVPPFEDAGFHKHAESRAGLDGIKPIIVLKAVTEDDFVQVIHAAMRPVRPDGFILRLLGHEFAVFIHANTGTFHNAAAMTAMSGIAAATYFDCPRYAFLDFHHRLGTNLIRAFKTANREVFCGQSACFIQDIDKNVGSVRGKSRSAYGM